MLRRETAYRLAGRRHHAEALPPDELCEREIRFETMDTRQIARAAQALAEIPGVAVRPAQHSNALHVSYNLAAHSCDELEAELEKLGLQLDHSLYARVMRAMIHFCEETRRRNMMAPERLIKQSKEVYVKAYQHHPHGDHDDTPPELRQIR